MDMKDLQRRVGVAADGIYGPRTREAVLAALTNLKAPALTGADFQAVAEQLGVDVRMIRAVREVEAPRGAFNQDGRPTILFEPHVFSRNTGGRFDASHPALSRRHWKPGLYGSLASQYPKLLSAVALDPGAAFKACSWGAFQVLGENAEHIGYDDAFAMAVALARSERAHLDSFARFVTANGLVDELRACRPGDPASCVPFVARYNGPGHAKNDYAGKLARAAL